MSPDDSADGEAPLRVHFSAELEQLRLQVELMGVRVDENLDRMRRVLLSASEPLALEALAADDDIDAMNVSLTDRCYQVLAREAPLASDLRLVVSVIRVIGELERIGDLALRVVKLRSDMEAMHACEGPFAILVAMAEHAIDQYRLAMGAWAVQDIDLATGLAGSRSSIGLRSGELLESLLTLSGPDAVSLALRFNAAGQALDRIADHSCLIGVRIRYLLTGDPHHLAAEVR